MRFLCICRFGFVKPRLFRHIAGAEAAANIVSDGANCLSAKLHPIGSHIGDQTGCFAADIDALIEFLRNLHCPAGGKPKLA